MMEVIGFGAMALFGLFGLGSGATGNDLVSLLPADKYFESRRVPINVENLEDLAKADPSDGRAQILQLVALRTLAERPELVKKSKNAAAVLKTLEKIAKGEIAKDRLGFAQEYATRALIALGSNIAKPKPGKRGDPREDCLGWFPASAGLIGFVDGRGHAPTVEAGKPLRDMLGKLIKEQRDWKEFFDFAEAVGNIRIDRISFAYASGDKDNDRLFLRVSGKANHKWLVEGLKNLDRGGRGEWKESKDAKGTPITTKVDRFGPAMAFIGDSDLVVAGHVRRRFNGGQEPNHMEVVEQVLAVRAGKEMSVLKGALKDRLPKVGDDTVGLLIGDLPEELRRDMARGGPPAPKSVRLEAKRIKDGIDLHFQAGMENADAAKDFTKFMLKMRQDGLDGLKKIPAEFPLPAATVQAMQKTLESIQLRPKGNNVEGAVYVPGDVLLGAPALFLGVGRAVDRPPPPPPPPPPIDRESRLTPALLAPAPLMPARA